MSEDAVSDDMVHGTDPRPIRRVAAVEAGPGQTLMVTWEGGDSVHVDLSGWIGLHDIAELRDEAVFRQAEVGEYGAHIQWGGNDDLAIDNVHLESLAEQQASFTAEDIAAWQERLKLSNREAADLLGVASSTWSLYKAGGSIPAAVQIACRAFERDQVLLEAHFKPRRPAGRPPRAA